MQMSPYQSFIYKSRYARWLESKTRRENYVETVNRYFDFFLRSIPTLSGHKAVEIDEVKQHVLSLDVMPSMRALMTAGKALERDHVAGYNCSAVAIDNPRAFDEILYVLTCGTGVGFSVERQYVNKLPEIAESMHETDTTIVVADSKIGWATAYRELIQLLYAGKKPKWDVSKVRPAGERLKTFGGRASGPEPLVKLFTFTTEVFSQAVGRKLTSIECHDIVCKIAEVIVVGGVRRSALISLSNLSDDRMRIAKSGQWWIENPQRSLANNSAVYTERPDMEIFIKEWSSLYESKSGERGIVNREAFNAQAAAHGREVDTNGFLTNPCGEVILRSGQFCNLSEIVIRPDDTAESLKKKVKYATILGTLQATLTNFRYLRSVWKRNTEEERLLGVSLTGIFDNPLTYTNDEKLEKLLNELRQVAVETNKEWSTLIGIAPSASITVVKPSGTVSQLVDCASGIHPRYSNFYLRRVRQDKKDPISLFLIDKGVPHEVDIMNSNNYVFTFPIRAPEGSVTQNEVSAIDHIKLWSTYQQHWCQHNPSITISYNDNEFLELGSYVYEHFDSIGGVSFLPRSNHTYTQAPYEAINKEQYQEWCEKIPNFSWEELTQYEKEDCTVGHKELACTAGSCEL